MYQYSQRLSWDTPTNEYSQLLQAKRLSGERLLDLSISNPTEAFAEYPHTALRDAYTQGSDFTYNPDPFGQEHTRLAVVDLYRRRGILLAADQLALTASTSEAYSLLFQLLGDPGSEILVPVPSYPLFEYLASLACVRIVPYRLTYDGAWFIDFENLQKQIGERTRAIVIVNPNNPTGSFLKAGERDELFRVAQNHGLPLISDEVFIDYAFGPSTGRERTLIGNPSVLSFSLDGLSKTAAMPQMKLGWIAMSGPTEEVRVARKRLELLLDTYLSVSTPVQNATPRLLEIGAEFQRQVIRRTVQNLSSLVRILENSPAHVMHTEGGWSAIVQLPKVLAEEAWVMRLLEAGVIVQPGYFFDMPSEAFVIVSLITTPDDFNEGAERIRTLVRRVIDNLHEGSE